MSKDHNLSNPDETYSKAEVLSKLESHIASLTLYKDNLTALFRVDFEKLYSLEQKVKAGKFENTKLFFKKKIEKLRPGVIEVLLKLNDVKLSIEKFEKTKEKLLQPEEIEQPVGENEDKVEEIE